MKRKNNGSNKAATAIDLGVASSVTRGNGGTAFELSGLREKIGISRD